MTGMIRYFYVKHMSYPQPLPDENVFNNIEQVIKDRVAGVDRDELNLTIELLREKVEEWKNYLPPKYGDFLTPDSELPLMYPAGSVPLEAWDGKPWATPTSMRNADAACEAGIIKRYLLSED